MTADIALADSRTRENFAFADTVGELIDQAAALTLPPSPITLFAESYPRAVDIGEDDYRAKQAEYDAAATAAGYRLAGFRLQRAVFSTKT